ncbi:hypothetical protein [Microbacterium yannicii]|jgi:hypothetical protein|uniref:hypothetical protein n=1 Tax=Microbacterium yannicii TaxID=671622 RepID=UPI0003064B7E|nr:hypothetical protein [Microbacterium yannicii]
MAQSRPVGVTIVAVLAWISGFFSILGGILMIISGLEVASMSREALIIAAVISIIVGIVVIIVSFGLFRGSNVARIIVTVVFVLNIVNAVIQMFTGTQSLWTALLSALPSIIGVILLYTKSANAFFTR